MENFGLGLVVGFQDNASSGIERVIGLVNELQSVINSLSQSSLGSISHLEGMSKALGIAGGAMTAFGLATSSAFGGFMHKVVDMGAEFEQTKIMLAQLYGSASEGKRKFEEIQQLSATTEFSSADLIPAYTRLKTIGIEADKTVTVMQRGKPITRSFIEALGDLATIRPDKGLETVIREGIEFMEGNQTPLRMSFGINVKKELAEMGETMVDTAQGRAEALVKVLGSRNYLGIMGSVNDSWKIIFSNLGDHFQQLAYWINENGFFNMIKQPFLDLQNYLNKLFANEDDSMKLGKAIADGLKMVAVPAITAFNILTKILGVIVEFSKENPKIVSLAIGFAGLASQLITLGGIALVSLALYLKMQTALIRVGGATALLSRGAGIARTAFMSLYRTVLPVTVALGALYFVYRNNIFGLRTIVGGTLTYLSNLFNVVYDAMTHIETGTKKFSLSKTNANLAEQMGLVPALRLMTSLYHYATLFVDGFSRGIDRAKERLNSLLVTLGDIFKRLNSPVLSKIADTMSSPVKEFKTLIDSDLANKISGRGYSFGEWAFALVGIVASIKSVTSLMTVARFVSRGLSFSFAQISRLSPIFSAIFSTVSRYLTSFSTRFVSVALNIAGVVDRIFRSLPTSFAQLSAMVTSFLNRLRNAISSALQGSAQRVRSLFSTFFEALRSFGEKIKDVFNLLKSKVGWFIANFSRLPSIIMGVVRSFSLVGTITRIASLFNPVTLAITILITAIVILVGYWDMIKAKAEEVWGHITNTLSNAMEVLGPHILELKEAFSRLASVFPILQVVFGAIYDFFTQTDIGSALVNEVLFALGVAFNTVFDTIVLVVEVAIIAITAVVKTIIDVFNGLIEFVTAVLEGRWEDAFNAMWDTVQRVFGNIKEFIGGVVDSISGYFDSLLGKASSVSEKTAEAGASAGVTAGESALGGIFSSPYLTWVAEAGYPEAIIPLDGSKRGIELWEKAGSMLGVMGKNVQVSPSDLNVNRGNPLDGASKFFSKVSTSVGEVFGDISPASSVGSFPASESVEVSSPAPSTSLLSKMAEVFKGSSPPPAPAPANDSSGGIVFEAGSIQFTVNTNDFDAEKASTLIIPIIQRKMEINRMMTRA